MGDGFSSRFARLQSKLVGMVFGTQALGLIIGPLVALALLGGDAGNNLTWRVLLGLGAVSAAAVLYLLAGTAGCWFLLDYAYYGNTISTPQILSLISPHGSTTGQDRPATGHLHNRGRTWLHPGHPVLGPDWAPAPAMDRFRGHGRVLPGPRRGVSPVPVGCRFITCPPAGLSGNFAG